ncbi:MAG: hypothetical protein M3463_07280 [Verrucomicrobiota bacterium]|nr:hypothetical protein [Verrucomicrobiota bacterium]
MTTPLMNFTRRNLSQFCFALALSLVTVSAAGFTLTAEPSSVSPGAPLAVSWTAPEGRSAEDWVALFHAGAPDGEHL